MLDTPIIGLIGCLTRSGVGAGTLAAEALLANKQIAGKHDPKTSNDPLE